MNKRVKLFLFSGVATIVFGIVMVTTIVPKVLYSQLQKSLVLERGSDNFEVFIKLPMPINFSIYLFNVSNPEEFTAGGKAIVKEVGPYVYEEFLEKEILDPGHNNDSITYMSKKKFIFNQNLSGSLTEDDNVTILNFAYMGIIIKTNEGRKGFVPIVDKALAIMLNGLKDPFLRATVGEVLFKGIFLNCSSSSVKLVCEGIKEKLPPGIQFIDTPTKKGFYMSLFGNLNGSIDGPFVTDKGNKNLYKLGELRTYKGKTNMDIFKHPCSEVRDTDGTIFIPMDKNNVSSKIYLFEPNLCRSVFIELVELKETAGIKTYRYEATVNSFGGKNDFSEKSCYCLRNWSSTPDTCALKGVYDLSTCSQMPVITSNPHLFLASEELHNYVDGINPIKEKHGTYLEIDRLTSGLVSGRKRMQINMQLEPINVPFLKNIKSGLFPITYFDEAADIPDDLAEKLKMAAFTINLMGIIQWLPLLTGVLLLVLSIFFHFKSPKGHLSMKSSSIYTTNASRDNGVKNNAFGMK